MPENTRIDFLIIYYSTGYCLSLFKNGQVFRLQQRVGGVTIIPRIHYITAELPLKLPVIH